MSKMFTSIKEHKWFLIASFIYIGYVLLVGIRGNYPTNDDWYFVRQVEAFSKGIYTLHAKLLPIFLVQGFFGLLWGSVFGITFESLRILTILITYLAGIFIYKAILINSIDRRVAVLGALIFWFNPLVLSSSFTFMTENYYLFFMILSVYFSLKYYKYTKGKDFYLSLVFIMATSLTRQTGAFLFLAFVLPLLMNRKIPFSSGKKITFVSGLFVTVCLIVLWPKYHTEVIDKSINLSDGFEVLIGRVQSYLLAIPSLVFWISPLLISSQVLKRNKKYLLLGLFTTLLVSLFVYKYDVFPLGSVFYFEGLHIKSGFKHSLSVFDNVPAKILMSLYIGALVFFVFRHLSVTKVLIIPKNPANQFFIFSVLGVLVPILMTAAVYDRYFLPLIVFIIPVLSQYAPKFEKKYILTFFVLFVVSSFQTYELVTVRSMKHRIFENLSNNTQIDATERDIYVDDTYSKYLFAEENEDYAGVGQNLPVGVTHSCFVQQYTRDTPLTVFLENLENKIERRIENPSIYKASPPIRDIRITKHLDELLYNEMYFSPLYSIIGKTAYVGGWCDK